MLFAAFIFSVMGACIKLASNLYSTSEIVMYRGCIGMVIMTALILHNRDTFRTPFLRHHLWRGIFGVTAMWLWFFSVGKLPLATGMTLNYMSSIWIAAIVCAGAIWHRKKQPEWRMVAAIGMSFIGVILLLRPTIHADQWFAGMVALASGILSALAYLQVRHLGQLGETEARVVFYLSTVGTVAGFLGTCYGENRVSGNLHGWHAHGSKGIMLILAIGVCATGRAGGHDTRLSTRQHAGHGKLAVHRDSFFQCLGGTYLGGRFELVRLARHSGNPCQRLCCDVLQRAKP